MLHVFGVNRGDLLTFEVNLAMKTVLELKNTIAEMHGIVAEKQVILNGSGEALCDNERVCSYAAGTETNPVYLFDKECFEKQTLQIDSAYQDGNDFAESIRNAQTLGPSYKTVDTRTKLAMRLHDATRHQVQHTKALVHDEHLMFQGWQAAVANLTRTVTGFKRRMEAMCAQCEALLQHGQNNDKVLDGMAAVVKSLDQIPVLPALLKGGKSRFGTNSDSFQVSLLHWIKTQCKNVSVEEIFNECKEKQNQLDRAHFSSLVDECKKVNSEAENTHMTEISGIKERLAGLDRYILDVEQQVKEQTVIAQGFMRNRDTVRDLHNNSSSIDALITLCESHVTQLQIMSQYEKTTRETLLKCAYAKIELAENLHKRLRWLYWVQKYILTADVRLSMFVQQLSLVQRQIEFLGQVKECPNLYLSSLAEVVRRKHFSDLYVKWANKAVAEARAERDREIVKRKTFESNIAGHFIQKLFQGLSDKPPSLSKKPLRTFDNDLPDITPEQLSTLSQLLPDYKDILEVLSSGTSSITSMTLTHSSTIMSLTPSANIEQSAQQMDSSASPPPNIRLLSMETSSKERQESPTGSFAMVDPSAIAQTQPGGFVVTSVENVKRANMDGNAQNRLQNVALDEHNLPQRDYSTKTHTSDQQSSSVSIPQDTSDPVFSQIGDIISPDSPPDSEFFSIMPGSLGSNQTPRERMDTQLSTPRDTIVPQFSQSVDCPDGKASTSSRKFSGIHVGSLDSNCSTSYQKVDDLSSDEEMFHSFTSDQQDVKSLRKRLHQLQTDYDSLLEESKLEKEELNVLIRKLRQEILSLNENQRIQETEFEKRWSDSKSELGTVIEQLENERLERKNAWAEGASLEKRLKAMEQEYQVRQVQMESVQTELNVKNDTLHKLKITFRDNKECASSALAESERKLEEITREKENEIFVYKNVSTKLEKEISLARTELSAAEDRIQDLETMLSDRERKQQEDSVKFQAYDAKIHELSTQLSVAHESHQQSLNEATEAKQKDLVSKQRLAKSDEQMTSLKNLLADYEMKLNDDKNKDSYLKNLRASLHQLGLEKLKLISSLESSRNEVENLKEELEKSKNIVQSLTLVTVQDAASHKYEVEKLRLEYQEEIDSSSCKHDHVIRTLNEKHENEMQELIKRNTDILRQKEEEWRSREDELTASQRNEMDELEADRLAWVATSQRTIEELREKWRESSQLKEQERKDVLTVKDSMLEGCRRLEEENARVLQENESLCALRLDLEEKLLQAQDEIRSLREIEKRDVAIGGNLLQESALTSSTDEEFESKRSKIDSGIPDEMTESIQLMLPDKGCKSVSLEEHNSAIGIMCKNFEQDKKSLTNLFKRREEEAAKRRQMIFNSAIQRVTTTKDREIGKLKDQLMVQSQTNNPAMSQSMMVPAPQPMAVSMVQPSVSSPLSSFFTGLQQPSFTRSGSPREASSSRADGARDKDKVAVANFHVGDTVLLCYNEVYQHFILLTTSRILYFLHHESLDKLGIDASNPESRKTMTLATLVEREYCQARKAQNRFRVPISTKFYRVKVAPLSKKESQV